MFNNFWQLLIVLTLVHTGHAQRKLICLDNKADVDAAGWKSNTAMKSAENIEALPKGFGDLKALQAGGNGIWYVEGPVSGQGKDVTFTSPSNLYINRARKINIYIKYYDNSPRRVSLFPVKPGSTGGNLFLLPLSTQVKWKEVKQEIDPNESPIELTAFLSSNQYILFEKIIIAVDTPLPSDLSITCTALTSLPVLSTTTTTRPIIGQSSTSSSPDLIRRSPLPDSTRSDCPALPPVPECKCNCLCNCSKC